VILLWAQPDKSGDDLATTVLVRKHAVKEEGAYCSEQINLYAPAAAVAKLPFVVSYLVIGDLPVNLWWASNVPPPLGGELAHDLAQHADQIIFDSLGWRDPPRGMAAVVNWIQHMQQSSPTMHRQLAADLNWRRLKYWRRLLSQALDPATAPGFLQAINEVVLEHGPHAVIQAWEFVSWLGVRLGWKVRSGKVQPGIEMNWQFQAKQGTVRVRVVRHEIGRSALFRMRIATPDRALSFTVGSERRLAVFEEGTRTAPRTVAIQPMPLPEMVATELSDRERDPIFHASLQVARELAQSVLQ
jgi:glucose-6-phosphate dehydrogenase assembly protein OpcA